jgi:uncharacterized protein YjbI with pentapeptide repeats
MAEAIAQGNEFYRTKFSGVNLTEQTLTGKIFEECDFKSCHFEAVNLERCKFVNCSFAECDFSNLAVPGSKFTNVSFNECKLPGVDWTKATWSTFPKFPHLQFHRCVISHSSFLGLSLEQLVVAGCRAHQVDFRQGNFSRGNFTRSDLARSLFCRTCLLEADFTDASNYDVDLRNNEIRWSKFSRQEAVRLLYSFEIELVD